MDEAASEKTKQFRSVREAVWHAELGPSSKLVALRLVEHWPRIFPSLKSLCTFTGLSERTVRGSLRKLEKLRVIETTRRRGTSSEYAFVGVSIPALGSSPRQNPPEGGEDTEPRQSVPPPGADSAPPPRQPLPPKPSRLSDQPKGGRPRTARTSRPSIIFHTMLGDWEPEPELLAEAKRVGLGAPELARRIATLRAVRLPPRRGVPDRGAYVMSLLEQWAKWERENLEKAQRRAGLAPRLSSWGGGATWTPSFKMKRYAADHGIEIDPMAEDFVRSGAAERRGNQTEADEAFIRMLVHAVRSKKAAA